MKRVEPISLNEFRAAMKRLRGVPLGFVVTAGAREEFELLQLRNRERKLREKKCRCGCGRTLNRRQAETGIQYATFHHARLHRIRRKLADAC